MPTVERRPRRVLRVTEPRRLATDGRDDRGHAATWVDATRGGRAVGLLLPGRHRTPVLPAHPLPRVPRRVQPRPHRQRADVRSVSAGSPGDYMAKGEGTCNVRGQVTRWAYFVAAPGFGPVRQLGIAALGPVRRGGGDPGRPEGGADAAAADRPDPVRRHADPRFRRSGPPARRRAPPDRSGPTLSEGCGRRTAVRTTVAFPGGHGCRPRPFDPSVGHVGRPEVGERDPRSAGAGENVPLVTSPISRSPRNTG